MPLAYGDIHRLLDQPESETLEVKYSIPRPSELAKLIGSFANTAGGVILFGLRDETTQMPNRLIGGIDDARLRRDVDRALLLLQPSPAVWVSVIQVEGKSIGAVQVAAPISGITSNAGQLWVRSGTATRPASVDQILSTVNQLDNGSTDRNAQFENLVEVIFSQGRIIEEMRDAQQSRKGIPIAFAGLMGIVIGCLLVFLIG
ncbi:ATP-binding protein [Streptomyces sp. AcH 505]|uniref:RNA-binding domain-containing protein n=1 Tax=Streptomyces sp. AcH 505 TaxID=352211 RepID=UPI00099BACEE